MKSALVAAVLCLFGCRLQAQVIFNLSSTPDVGNGPNGIVATDVNGDGKLDLINANYYGNSLTVLTNNGSGSFVLSGTYTVGRNPNSVAAADVNGDGKVDLICVNSDSGDSTVSVLTNNGSGGFMLSGTYPVGIGPQSVAAADVNGDGKEDLITANWGSSAQGNTLTILTNNGSGGFVLASLPVVGTGPNSVTAADVNGDGKVDLISANRTDSTVSVLTNNGTGGFVLAGTHSVGSGPVFVTAADVNGDGKVDLITANWGGGGGNTLTVLTNNGSGGFVFRSTLTVGSGAIYVAAADVNGDGKVDLISANLYNNTLSVLTNNGSGGFMLATNLSVGSAPQCVVAADVNGDGKPDLVNANSGYHTLSVLTNATVFPTPCGPVATAVAFEINGFTVSVTIVCGGSGYTTAPAIHFVGGGGSGVQAVATVSNGVVTSIQVINPGSGYTNAPLVVIGPPSIPNPVLGINPISFLAFTNLFPGTNYQLQQLVQGAWTNQFSSFTATSVLYTVAAPGVVSNGAYRLALMPVPSQAFATAQLFFGFVIGATVTSPGSGYVSVPAVAIVGGGGSGATALAQISGGAVTNVQITAAGSGYTGVPTIQIDPPPAAVLTPAIWPGMQVNSTNLIPNYSYQLEFTPNLPPGGRIGPADCSRPPARRTPNP